MGVLQQGRTEKEIYMNLTNASGQAFRRIAMGAAALAVAVAGSLAVAAPAQADTGEGTYCVATVPETNVRCFDTFEQAKAFVASVAEVTPDEKPSAAAVREYGEAMKASPAIFWPVLIFTGFDWENYNPIGGVYLIIGLNGPCTTSTANVDYSKATLPARWDNDISSYFDHSNCWTRLYANANFGGSFRGYTGDSATLGNFNNIASSIRWS